MADTSLGWLVMGTGWRQVWDLRAPRTPLLTLKCGRHGVRDLALDARSGLMAAALGQGTTRVYTLDGAKAGVLAPEPSAHKPRFVACCAWGPDDTLFTAGLLPRHPPPPAYPPSSLPWQTQHACVHAHLRVRALQQRAREVLAETSLETRTRRRHRGPVSAVRTLPKTVHGWT